jgi:2-oxoglutarate dehydrogenase E1 component
MHDAEQLPNPGNLQFVEDLYESYLADSQSVSPEWQSYFARLRNGDGPDQSFRTQPSFRPASIFNPPSHNGERPVAAHGSLPTNSPSTQEVATLERQHRVTQMARAYREWGHRNADLDPLDRPRPAVPELDPAYYGLTAADMDIEFVVGRGRSQVRMPLRRIVEMLQNTYCRSIGVQYTHIDDNEVKLWLEERMESTENRLDLSRDDQLRILTLLTDAAMLEDFLHKRYQGKKRFSLEGAESMIPLLQITLNKAAQQQHKGIVLGMAHRGRLNVLAHIIGMSPKEIFREFEGNNPEYSHRSGDVKYHLGHSAMWTGPNGWNIHLSLCFNPSHLEYVNPIVMGRVRAWQDRHGDTERNHRFGIQIHGDAAFAGEGIVQECLNMSKLRGYDQGGSLHLVVNNQVGFTTDPRDDRSTEYCTDIALMLQIPIFHVNGEDPEAVAQVVELAMDFRQRFRRDVVIDMYCYRKHGHNEQDEPRFTQPMMYKIIDKKVLTDKRSVREEYVERLLKLGNITREEADQLAEQAWARFDADFNEVRKQETAPGDFCSISRPLGGLWDMYRGGLESLTPDVPTAIDRATLDHLFARLNEIPQGFTLHPTLANKWLVNRQKIAGGELPVDWGAAESLALASLAAAGHRIRLSGQDSERGTFGHRMAVLHDNETNATYMPLANVDPNQATVEVYNSPLSEEGVMGFEFGYSLDMPDGLILWEAQFGDFANSAQVIIDQFVAGSEAKWNYLSGLVLLLPTGFEGMGPEHSSARLERFLQLAGEDNMQVVMPTTPAQIFHLLRRQVLRPWRKPLIVMTPKKGLRLTSTNFSEWPIHLQPASTLDELANGSFQRILPDYCPEQDCSISLVVICSGKIYWELAKMRADLGRADVAILRIEQLYPLSDDAIAQALEPYADGLPLRWVQEEPENMGAWHYIQRRLQTPRFSRFNLQCVSRPQSASVSTGSEKVHLATQRELVERAFII